MDDAHNIYGTPFLVPDAHRGADERRRLANPPETLDADARRVVRNTIVAHCACRQWTILALQVRSNHVHLVVENPRVPPETVLTQLKAWCTHRWREAGLAGPRAAVWTHHGSTRYLWHVVGVRQAVDYVTDGQGHDLP